MAFIFVKRVRKGGREQEKGRRASLEKTPKQARMKKLCNDLGGHQAHTLLSRGSQLGTRSSENTHYYLPWPHADATKLLLYPL